MRSILLENDALLQMCFFFVFFLTPKMFHLSVEAIQLYMMRQAGPLKSLCLWDVGGWRVRVEVRLWIPLHACVVDVVADDKRRITFLPRSRQKRAEVFVAVVAVVSQCGLVDSFSVA